MGYGFASESPRFEQKTRHAKTDALTDHEFELLYEAAQQLPKDRYSLQALWVVIAAGRLGLRRGEIAHMHRRWVDWDQQMIRIPRHRECDCGECRQAAQQKDDHNHQIGFEQAMDKRWHPKTEKAIRDVPFGFSPRVEVMVDRFFNKYDEYPHSEQSVNRRVERAAEHSDALDADDLYPHALRATAATFHAGRGLSVTPLQSLMGWSDLSTPMKYVQRSGKNTARELSNIHNR